MRRRAVHLQIAGAAALGVALLLGCAGDGLRGDPRPTVEDADALVAAGETVQAAELYAALAGGDHEPDRALLMLAVLELDRSAPPVDSASAFARLERLAAEYPRSPYLPAARALLALRGRARELESEVARLTERLEAFKRIDLDPPDG